MTDHETQDAPLPQPASGTIPPVSEPASGEIQPVRGVAADDAGPNAPAPGAPAPGALAQAGPASVTSGGTAAIAGSDAAVTIVAPASAATTFLVSTRQAANHVADARPAAAPDAVAVTAAGEIAEPGVADDAAGTVEDGREAATGESHRAAAAEQGDDGSAVPRPAAATASPGEPAQAPAPVVRRRRLALVGFGSVGRALVRLLDSTRDELASRHGVAFDVTLLATRRSGAVVDPLGIPPASLEALAGIAEETGWLPPIMAGRHVYQTPKGTRARGPFRTSGSLASLLTSPETPYDVLLELSTVSPADGRPAVDHLRAALGSGRDAVSANKAPVAWHGAALNELARAHGAHLRHEATTMDCLPVHAVRGTLVPVGRIERFAGVVNSTTNIVLSTMASGGSADDGLAEARRLGIAEADATNDTSGMDAALKATILANLLLDPDEPLTPDSIDCEGIADMAPEWPAEAAARGARVRLVARGEVVHEAGGWTGDEADSAPVARSVRASVRPEELQFDDPLAGVNGASMALTLDTEHAGRLTFTLTEPHVQQTAYALLMDLLAIDRARG